MLIDCFELLVTGLLLLELGLLWWRCWGRCCVLGTAGLALNLLWDEILWWRQLEV
jgi:hypothetical protein